MKNLFTILTLVFVLFATPLFAQSPLHVTGNIHLDTLGFGILLKTGTNGRADSFVCNGTTPVTVANNSFQITDIMFPSLSVVGGTVGALPTMKTVTAGTGFTVTCAASDTSTYNYALIGTRP